MKRYPTSRVPGELASELAAATPGPPPATVIIESGVDSAATGVETTPKKKNKKKKKKIQDSARVRVCRPILQGEARGGTYAGQRVPE